MEVSSETGVKKANLLLELDFKGSDSNNVIVPALKTPPYFIITETKKYYEGYRPNSNEPDWFYKNVDKACYDSNIPNFIQ